jgi:AbrB family looped-hinge helix DNA binding protein
MASIARSKLTAQGQVSIPAEVRRRLGVGPGGVLEWDDAGGAIVVRKAGRYSFDDLHRALFPKGAPRRKPLEQLDEGVRRYVRKRHARR